MCRSSRLTSIILGLALLPSAAQAQFYGFPSEVGVLDDGFGVLPPLPPQVTFGEGATPAPPLFVGPPAPPPPCPLVIRVGPGLRKQASTRVVYGRPACS